MTTLLNPYFGEFGGMYVPQILMPALRQLEEAFVSAQKDPEFQAQLNDLLKNYAGRPTALTKCQNITAGTNTTLYLKREDLLHGGAHKTNQVLGQALLAKRMGKTEIIAETGAGQHGVASALASALLGLKCRIYMGAKDVERQSPNVFRMRLMGAEVIPVHSGSATLKDACNEALRDWSGSYETAHYMLGTAAGPHPYPTIVREFQRMIGEETKAQILERRSPAGCRYRLCWRWFECHRYVCRFHQRNRRRPDWCGAWRPRYRNWRARRTVKTWSRGHLFRYESADDANRRRAN